MLLVVETIDPTTRCWLEMKQVLLTDLNELVALLDLEDFEFQAVYDLQPEELRLLESAYDFSFSDRDLAGEMVVFQREQPFPDNLHTGRELLLMLAGTKPMAAFQEPFPVRTPESVIPEHYFEPYVANGRFLKRVEMMPSKATGTVRRVLYAAPDQQWRMAAYIMLWVLAEKHGWNDGFEKAEGYLLGYETQIDSFFDVGSG